MSVFAGLIGQPQAIALLTQAITKQRVAPAYLFTGARGVGRSLAAERFLEQLLSGTPSASVSLRARIQQRNHPDLLWVEPTYLHQGKRLTVSEAATAGVKRKTAPIVRLEQVREIAQFLGRSPLEAPRSIVVIDQAETMPEGAANALLKTLEEPGPATLMLLAPSPESLLPTLVSRCQRIPFQRLSPPDLAQVLHQIGQAEVLQHPEVVQLAQGSPGAAITHWQQLQAIPSDLLAHLTQGPDSIQAALSLARQIDQTVESEAHHWLVDYLQQCYWRQRCANANFRPIDQQRLCQLEQAHRYLQRSVQPRLVWEVTLLGLLPS